MASRRLVRDLFLSRQSLFRHLTSQSQESSTRQRLLSANGCSANRQFSVFNEFSKRLKGEANKNPDFQKSVKDLKEKAEELKGVKEELKVRTKQRTEQLYKQVDGVWTEAEAKAKKVSSNMKEKISVATEEVKEAFGVGKQQSTESTSTSTNDDDVKDRNKASDGEQTNQQSGPNDSAHTFFSRFRSSISSTSVSLAFQKFKEAKFVDMAKKGYGIVKDELNGSPRKKKHLEHDPPSTSEAKRSSRTDIVVVPTKQSRWSKKWEAFKNKMHGHPAFKRISYFSQPVVTKSQEIAEDVREKWETSDNPLVHKIQDFNETLFQETDTAATIKEIRQRDPYFSLPEFVAEVQEVVRPVLNAYIKGDTETLKKYCTSEVIERCKAEHTAYQSHGIFLDNKILHISDAEVRDTKMMGASPIIIVAFQTQQVYCVRDRNGSITEGGKDTIHTVYYAWAMQQLEPEELGEGAIYPIWRLREMQQLGVQSLI